MPITKIAWRLHMVSEMVDAGHLIPLADGVYEDMGGHIIREDNAFDYIEDFLTNYCDDQERKSYERLRAE